MQALVRIYVLGATAVADRREGDRGATAVEYGLIVALIAAVVIGGVTFLGSRTRSSFNSVTVNFPS